MKERRAHRREGAEERIAGVLVAASDAYERRESGELLAWVEAVRGLVDPRSADERRVMMIAARRVLDRKVLRAIVDRAIRHPEEQQRAAAVLGWMGADGFDAMIDGVMESEQAQPRQFLHDALAGDPSVYPLLAPFLSDPRPHAVRHAAELVGLLGNALAVDPLARLIEHPAERVRFAAIRSLAALDAAGSDDALRRALVHPSALTRVETARVLGDHNRWRLVGALLAAFDRETESAARREFAGAAVRLGAGDALAKIALDRKSLLWWRGRPVEVRLDAVAGLAAAGTAESRRLLDRMVRQGDAPVRDAADRALSIRRLPEG